MIDAAYVQRMARYNRWQNENLYGASAARSSARSTRRSITSCGATAPG
jgi:hypothetical protein